MRLSHPTVVVLALLATCNVVAPPTCRAAPTGNPVFTDPAATDDDFAFQGEYAGETAAGPVGVQVVALGDGRFDVVAYRGGLPGAGWTPPEKVRGTGRREGVGADAVVRIEGVDWSGTPRRAEIRAGRLVVTGDDGTTVAELPKTTRESPTLGMKPPAGAVVICDGPGPVDEAETLVKPRLTPDGLLMEGVTTKDEFGNALWHVEFRLPYQPKDRGQARGNSGAYFQGAYEVQMLDSFGLDGKNNECGGVYSVAAPAVNMCLPPLSWQTYDVDFKAPVFEDGKKIRGARMTVRHNGVVVHDDVEVSKVTPGGTQGDGKTTGPLHLQNHGNPVRYRNIWVLPKP